MRYLKLPMVICLVVGTASALTAGGYYWAKSTIDPEYITVKETVIETVTEIVNIPIEVEKVVVHTEYVDRRVEVTREMRDFPNLEALEEFVENDNADSMLKFRADANGIMMLNNQCEDRALQLIDNAQKTGWRLFLVPLHREEYKKWYGDTLEEGHYHAVVGALVGDNEFYYIEPSDDRCWLALYLD